MCRKAMVIEDDFDASVIFAKALEVLGFETDVVRDGAVAMEKLAAIVPEIIVLDLHLPNVVGTQILAQIRADERLAGTRVIVATADPRAAELIQPDADLVLIKPTTFSQVRDLASRLISVPRSQSKRAQNPESTSPDEASAKVEPASAPDAEAKSESEPVAESQPKSTLDAEAKPKDEPTVEAKPKPAPDAEPEK